jgi:hypothetical protein
MRLTSLWSKGVQYEQFSCSIRSFLVHVSSRNPRLSVHVAAPPPRCTRALSPSTRRRDECAEHVAVGVWDVVCVMCVMMCVT